MQETNPFFDFSLHYLAPVGAVMLLGLLGGKVTWRLNLPRVTGYLLTGIIIGPSLLGLISHETVKALSIITDIALGLILFSLGGVFELHHIRDVGRKAVWLTVGQAIGAVVLVTIGCILAGLDWYTALLLGTIGIEIAPAATLMVVRECEAKGEFTDMLVTVMAISSIICILSFEFVLAIGKTFDDNNFWHAFLSPIYEIGGSLLVGGAVGWIISKWEQRVHDQAELLMIIVAGIALVIGLAMTLGLQPLFAALIMGAVTTNLSLMHRLVWIELRQIEQPLYIAFFVLAGASLHLDLLPKLGLVGLAYLVFRIVGKLLGTYIIARAGNMSTNIRRYLGLGMMVQAGLAIGLVEIVNRQSPELGMVVAPVVLATVLICETFGPPVVRFVLTKIGEANLD